jgi:D-alanine-D-alanine ligase
MILHTNRKKYTDMEVVMGNKLRIGVIYGGKSGEHEVSLLTAFAVIKAFDFDKYTIIPFYITKQGQWRRGPELVKPVENMAELTWDRAEAKDSAANVQIIFQQSGEELADGEKIDVVFPLLHGTFGEDGTIQGLLEIASVPYVGAGVLASAVGMDKVMMKKIFAHEGLPQCVYRSFTRRQWEEEQSFYLLEVEVSIGYPCFVKPANLGSSVGISKAYNREQLLAAVELAFQYDRKVIVEEFIDGREIEVGVLGNDNPLVSVPGEIVSSNEFYDYNAKYIDGKSKMLIPAEIPSRAAEEIQQLAVKAFTAIEASGLSRVDFFYRESDGAILINEINTMPGFTPYSMYPMLWQASGKSYSELIDDLIRLALERYNERKHIRFGLDDK